MKFTYQRGAITASQKAQLAAELTPVLLIGEVGLDTPQGRAATYILFEEKDPATEWFIGGEPDFESPKGGRFLLEIWYLEGAATQGEKTDVHAKMNEIIARIVGVDGTFPNRLGDWVIINEVAEGTWGASGTTVGIAMANQALGGAPERAEYFDRFLAAKQHAADAHGLPVTRS